MTEQRKAVIKNADMSEDMQQEAVDCASQALSKYNIEKVSTERAELTALAEIEIATSAWSTPPVGLVGGGDVVEVVEVRGGPSSSFFKRSLRLQIRNTVLLSLTMRTHHLTITS